MQHQLKVFSVYDSKAEAFLTPFFSGTTATALRSFEAACNDPQHDFLKYGADYTLFEIGSWDSSKGVLIPLQALVSLGLANQFLSPEVGA